MAQVTEKTDITIAARDGYSLAATVYPSPSPQAVVLINSAAATPRKIYRAFSEYLAQRGFNVVTYDYRGVGGSSPPTLRGFPGRMRDWAGLDVAAVVDYARSAWPQLPLTF